MKNNYLIFVLLLLHSTGFSQSNFNWASRSGDAGSDAGWSVATDDDGNVYTTGFFSNTVDFDPDADIVNLTSMGYEDIFISKSDADGNLLWARQMGGADGDRGFSIATDAAGNVYATGAFVGTADFDPGSGTFNMTSAAGYGDMFIVKLDLSGNLIWAKQYGGSGSITGYSIALDAGGNVHATGSFVGTIDFNPGAGSYNLTSTGTYDIFICKADPGGNFVWAKQMGGTTGTEINVSNAITVDADGNVYTTGAYESTTDFDPGAGYYPLDSTGFYINKLDAMGNFVWAKKIVSINVMGNAITTDNAGNVITAGSFAYAADFDPGSGISYQTSSGGRDIFILKLTAAGELIWMKQMGSVASGDYAYGLVTDAGNNIYTTGSFSDVADFDPGAATYTLSSFGSDDIFISKLDASGTFVCATQMGGTGSDYAYSIILGPSNTIYTAGAFMNTADFDPGSGTYILNSAGTEDIFISSITECSFGVGEDEIETAEDQLVVFPNPSTGKLSVRMKDTGMLSSRFAEVYNELGECIEIINIEKSEIDLQHLSKGVYLLKLSMDKEIITKKIIIL